MSLHQVETAIKVLRQASYFEHALYLAEKHNEHNWYLKILLEDAQDYQKAIDCILPYQWTLFIYNYLIPLDIGTLNFFEAEKNLKKCGKNLVSCLPEQTTNLLMKLCTLHSSPSTVASEHSVASASGKLYRAYCVFIFAVFYLRHKNIRIFNIGHY